MSKKPQLGYTMAGARMHAALRAQVIEVMTDPQNDGLSQKELSEKVGVSTRTFYNYLTPEVWEEIRKRRMDIVCQALKEVDQAILDKAKQGDVSAAKLVYSRWQEQQERQQLVQEKMQREQELPQSLADVEAELEHVYSALEQYDEPADA